MILPNQAFHPGDWVIYRKHKSSKIPGPRAENVHAASKGNLYRYTVDKFWVVDSIDADGMLQLRTRRGKRHAVRPDDPSLRKARLWERWFYRNRFDSVIETHAEDETNDASTPRPVDTPDTPETPGTLKTK